MTFSVEKVEDLNALNIEGLVKESEEEGYRFLTRLVEEYKDGSNTFDQPGEALYCVRDNQDEVIAVGGVNQSPFADDEKVARLQRFYVESNARRRGAGSLLLKEITNHARAYFKEMTVRTESSKADSFYRHNGFDFDDSASETTHILKFEN